MRESLTSILRSSTMIIQIFMIPLKREEYPHGVTEYFLKNHQTAAVKSNFCITEERNLTSLITDQFMAFLESKYAESIETRNMTLS
jgi:hypothetical protein